MIHTIVAVGLAAATAVGFAGMKSQQPSREAIVEAARDIMLEAGQCALVTLGADGAAQAEEVFRQALQQLPHHPRFIIGLGDALRSQGRLDEAIAQFQRAVNRDPGHAQALGKLGASRPVLFPFRPRPIGR